MTSGRSIVLGTAKLITLEAAKKLAAAGEAEARKNGWNVAIAIVDVSGGLILFHKLDETQAGSIAVAQGKARAAARSRALRRQGHPDGPRHPRRPARAHRPLTDDPPNGAGR